MTTKTLKQWVEETQEFPLEQSLNKEAFAYVLAQMSLNLRNAAKPTFPEKDNSENSHRVRIGNVGLGHANSRWSNPVPTAKNPNNGILATIKRNIRKLSTPFNRSFRRNRDNSNADH